MKKITDDLAVLAVNSNAAMAGGVHFSIAVGVPAPVVVDRPVVVSPPPSTLRPRLRARICAASYAPRPL